MHKTFKFISFLGLIAVTLLFLNAKKKSNIIIKNNEAIIDSLKKNVSDSYEIKAVKIPDYIDFAGEQVPLHKADVRERLDRELLVNTYWQSNGLLLLKRANKFFPVIEPILADHGLPDDFKYLALAESGLMNVTSRAGASGFWQFLRATGREYGLEVNDNVDERYNVELATKMAARYLKKSKEKFGSWSLAAAAYNAGNGKINLRLTQQKVSNYYDLLLNPETSRYVFRILALKEIISQPKKYGFAFDQEDLYLPTPTYDLEVNYSIANLADFAKKYNITYKELKLENPWLRQTKLNNASKKKYIFKIPIQ